MIEEKLREYLMGKLNLPVYCEIPENLPDTCVAIDRIGGGMTNRMHNARFAVQSYGTSLKNAAELNESVKAALDSADIHSFCMAAKLENDYNFADLERRKHRYQAIYEIYY